MSGQAFGTITPFCGSHKIGLDATERLLIKPVQKRAISKWTVQSVDNQKSYYRLYLSDGEKEYALHVPEDATHISAFEASPASLESHVWFIPRLANKFFVILDPGTIKAWKVNGATVELVEPPNEEDGLEPFKFEISFSN